MKKCFVLFFCFPLAIYAQNYPNVQVKEFYDANLESTNPSVMPSSLMESLVPDGNNGDLLGDRVSKVLTSLLRLYETTGDKAYLIKFVKNSFIEQTVRNDNANSSNHPGWSQVEDADHPSYRYLDGYILKSMAEFVYMVRFDSQLFNTALPSSTLLDINSSFFPQSLSTYGDYANWLGMRVEETLDWYVNNGYWDDNKGMLDFNNHTLIINMQAGFGLAFFYMGNSDPRPAYQTKANVIASLYKSQVNIDDRCNCGTYNEPVFRLNANNTNAYFWYDNGWKITQNTHGCTSFCPFHIYSAGQQDNLPEYTATPEDLSHAVPDLWVPLVYNRFAPNSYFDQNDMIRWRNTLAKNIYDNGDFHNNCLGNEISNVAGCPCAINQFKDAAYAWMPFYQWDEADFTASAPDVYDIVMLLFISEMSNGLPSNFNGAYYGGLGDVVTAQWDKECVNLSMYKRDVVYDQDFSVKNILTVEPESNSSYNTTNSFADPVITTNEFTIEPGVTSNMTAGEEIILKPGFHAKAGCTFSAHIDPSACTDGHRMEHLDGNNNGNIPVSSSTASAPVSQAAKAPVAQNSLGIYPNPTDGIANIYFSIEEKSNVTVKIVDEYGQEIFSEINNVETEQGNYTVPFDTKNLHSGVYFCILRVNGEAVQTKKMVVL